MNGFHRVTWIGAIFPRPLLARLRDGAHRAPVRWGGRTVAMSAAFENKPGGGGHVRFFRQDDGNDVGRLVLEPDENGWLAAAWIGPRDYDREDVEVRIQALEWLRELFGALPIGEHGGRS